MEDDPVVEAVLGEGDEVVDRGRRLAGIEVDDDVSVVGAERRRVRLVEVEAEPCGSEYCFAIWVSVLRFGSFQANGRVGGACRGCADRAPSCGRRWILDTPLSCSSTSPSDDRHTSARTRLGLRPVSLVRRALRPMGDAGARWLPSRWRSPSSRWTACCTERHSVTTRPSTRAKARTYVDGSSDGGFWNDFRAPGLPFMLQAVWPVRATEPYLRMVVVAWGALGLLVTWLLGRFLFGAASGLIAAAGLAVSPIWVSAVDPRVARRARRSARPHGTGGGHRRDADRPGLVVGDAGGAADAWRPRWFATALLGLSPWAASWLSSGDGRAVVRDWPRVVAIASPRPSRCTSCSSPPRCSARTIRRWLRPCSCDPTEAGRWLTAGSTYWEQLPELLAQPAVMLLFAGIGLALVARTSTIRPPSGRVARSCSSSRRRPTCCSPRRSPVSFATCRPLLPWLWIASAAGLGVDARRRREPRQRLRSASRSRSALRSG